MSYDRERQGRLTDAFDTTRASGQTPEGALRCDDDLTVIDIASAAIAASQERLGERAEDVQWLVGDVLDHDFSASFPGR